LLLSGLWLNGRWPVRSIANYLLFFTEDELSRHRFGENL
jgi:hypothetical protein